MDNLPAVGAAVNLRWRDRWVTARVVRRRDGEYLDLEADGIDTLSLRSVGHSDTGWRRLDEIPDTVLDWKQRHANDSEAASEHPIVLEAVANLCDNLNISPAGLAGLAMLRLANTVAQVARAQALGFDPDLLRMTADEANQEMIRRAAELVMQGVPVRVIGL